MISRMWARVIIWWHNVCPIHFEQTYKYWDRSSYLVKFRGRKCIQCYDDFVTKKRKQPTKQSRLDWAMNELKQGDEKWQTLNKHTSR